MKQSSVLQKLTETLKLNATPTSANFIQSAGCASILANLGDERTWKPFQKFWANQNEVNSFSVYEVLIKESEELVILAETKKTTPLKNILWLLQIKTSLLNRLNKAKPLPDYKYNEFEKILERAYRVPKSQKSQCDIESLMLEVKLPSEEWIEAIKYAEEEPLICQDPNLYLLNLDFKEPNIQMAAALTNEFTTPPQAILEKGSITKSFKKPFAFHLRTYLTQDWMQVIEIDSEVPIALISWLGTRTFYDETQKTYLFEAKVKPEPFHYLDLIKESVIRIISQNDVTIEINLSQSL